MKLVITKLQDLSELEDFRCGVGEIDNIIDRALDKALQRSKASAYVVRMPPDDNIVAVFALSPATLTLDTYDINELHGDYSDVEEDDVRYENYPAIELELLAVRTDMRDKHIGSSIINIISEQFDRFGFNNELFIMVDAYFEPGYTAVPFYERCGFRSTGHHHSPDTMRMFKVLAD